MTCDNGLSQPFLLPSLVLSPAFLTGFGISEGWGTKNPQSYQPPPPPQNLHPLAAFTYQTEGVLVMPGLAPVKAQQERRDDLSASECEACEGKAEVNHGEMDDVAGWQGWIVIWRLRCTNSHFLCAGAKRAVCLRLIPCWCVRALSKTRKSVHSVRACEILSYCGSKAFVACVWVDLCRHQKDEEKDDGQDHHRSHRCRKIERERRASVSE
jgi:hypothetical protein